MKLKFHPQVAEDLKWFRAYFGDAAEVAIDRYFKMLDLLCSSPGMGRPVPEKDAREYAIPRMPFTLIYRATPDTIEVLRIWDQRADRVTMWDEV